MEVLTLPADEAILQMEDALLGEGLTPEASGHLAQAAAMYQDDEIAQRHLRQAALLAPKHPAVLIGTYRFYFYKGRLREALEVARVCLDCGADIVGLPRNWRKVQREQADFGKYESRWPRFYLFTLKAYAYLQLRLGAIEEGQEAISKLLELEPTDKVGARVLQRVLELRGHDDD